MASIYQQDFKLGQTIRPGEPITRVTLALSPTGDIQLVEGKEKLVEQLIFAVVNDNVARNELSINSRQTSKRQLLTLATLIMRNFRQNQIYQTEESDPRIIGYYVYRFDRYVTSTDFIRASSDPVTWKFSDLKLTNGTKYTYGVTYLYRDGQTESSILEKLDITPTQHLASQNPVIGKYFVALPSNQAVTIYVDYNRIFKKSELLESVEQITVDQDPSEPRGYVVNIAIKSLDGNGVSISSLRYKAE